MREVILKRNGNIIVDGNYFQHNYLKLLIRNGETLQVVDFKGEIKTVESLVTLIGKTESNMIDLISLLDVEILYEIVRCGGINEYKRRL